MARPMRSIGKMETWEPPDKSFSKFTVEEGAGELSPNEGSVCQIGITLVDAVELDPADLGNYEIKELVEVTLGEGDAVLADLFDKVLLSMKAGEACYVRAKCDIRGAKLDDVLSKDKGLKFNMFLQSFERAADFEELTGDEKLEKAQHQKNKGTELFQKGRIDYAIRRYEKALVCLGGRSESRKLPGELPQQHKTLILQCHLNLAAAFLKKEQHEDVVSHCSEALEVDGGSVKGLFRRGQAYVKLQRLAEAKEDFSRALDIEKDNKAVRAQLASVEDMMKKEKQLYQKMFS